VISRVGARWVVVAVSVVLVAAMVGAVFLGARWF
jgi:NADH:ubiquinone oxidoreductase subunit 6 (subunit J)